jgi:hypothetical protein
LPNRHQIAVFLDDCKKEDTARVMARIQQFFEERLLFGLAHCPSDGLDPEELLNLAVKRLQDQCDQK